MFVSTDKSGASSVIRVTPPTGRFDSFDSAARDAYLFNEVTRAQREVESTGKRDVTVDNSSNYAAFERVFTDLNPKRKDNEVARALTGLPYQMSNRESDIAYEVESDLWKESADTLRQAVGTNPYDNDEDNAMFDSMCTEAADTYEYEIDRLEKLRRGH